MVIGETDQFLGRYKLPKPRQEEINNLNRSTFIKEFESGMYILLNKEKGKSFSGIEPA